MKRLLAVFVRHRRSTLLALFATLAASVFGASRLELKLNYFELLPKDTREVLDLEFVSKKTGGQGYVIVELVKGTRDERIAAGRALTLALSADPEVAHVEFERELDPALAPWLLDDRQLAEAIRKIEQETQKAVEAALDLDSTPASQPSSPPPFAFPRFVEANGAMYVIMKPSFVIGNIPRMEAFVERVRGIAAQATKGSWVRAELGGPMLFNLAFVSSIQRDLQRISVLGACLVAIALFFATRSVRASLLLLLPVGAGIALSLAVAWLTIGHLTIISGLLVALLAGLGVESGIHIYLRWREGGSLDVTAAAAETIPGSLTGALTNAAAFFVLVGCDLQAFREFGVIAGLGILLTFAATFAFLPALLGFLPVEAAEPARNGRVPLPRAIVQAFVVLGCAGALLGALEARRLRINHNFAELHGQENPDQAGLRASAALGASLMPTIAWTASRRDADAFVGIAKKSFHAVRSLDTLIAKDTPQRRERHERLAELVRRVPTSWLGSDRDRLLRSLGGPPPPVTALPEWLTRIYVPSDGDGSLVVIESGDALEDDVSLEAFSETLAEVVDRARVAGVDVRVLSENLVAERVFTTIKRDGPFIAWATVAAVAGALLLLIRRPLAVLLLMAPLAVGALLTIVFVLAARVPLNFINLAIVPSLMTMAIDNVVHIYHRYEHEGADALPAIAYHSGHAVLAASAVNFSGYAAALVARFEGLHSLGALASLGVLAMILATVPWFVSLLRLLPRKR